MRLFSNTSDLSKAIPPELLCRPLRYLQNDLLENLPEKKKKKTTKNLLQFPAGGFLSVCDKIRTRDLLVRSQTLYPAELHIHIAAKHLFRNEDYYTEIPHLCQCLFAVFSIV